MSWFKKIVLTKTFLVFILCMFVGYKAVGSFLGGTFLGVSLLLVWLLFFKDRVSSKDRKLLDDYNNRFNGHKEDTAKADMAKRRLEGGRVANQENVKPRGLEDRFKL